MQRFRVVEEDLIVPEKFYCENFMHGKSADAAPEVYPVVEQTMKEFPSFSEWLPHFVLYNWEHTNGFATTNTQVRKCAVENNAYHACGGMNVSPAVGDWNEELEENMTHLKGLLKGVGLLHKNLKPDEISLNKRMEKQKFEVISGMDICPGYRFSLTRSPIRPEYIIFGYHALVEGPERKFPSPEEIESDAKYVATIIQCAHNVFADRFLRMEMPKDDEEDLSEWET